MANEWMKSEALRNVTTGWCKIATPDTTFFTKGGAQKPKPPQWKVEVIVDRDDKGMTAFFSKCREHLRAMGEEVADDAEPWVRVHPEKTVEKDGQSVTYPSYEYISVMTTKDPHTPTKTTPSHIIDERGNAFTDEVWKDSEVSIVVDPKYDTVHKYLLTFYLGGMKVHRNGSGQGSGGGGDPMALLGVPTAEELGEDSADDVDIMAEL